MLRLLLPLFLSAPIAYPVSAQIEPLVTQPTTSGVGVGEPAAPSRESLSPGGRQVTPLTGLVTIESDLQKADNNTGVVTATGNVRILYPDRGVVATARQAQYFSKEGRVVLSGDVDIIQDKGNSLRAERIVYLVERERIIADPAEGQQVIIRYYLNSPVGAGMGVLDGPRPPRP
jgi:lipopolysaccharide export system protein LptA